MVLGDSREGLDSCFDKDGEEEEKLLKQAIALPLERAVEKDTGVQDNNEQEDGEEEEEELMLRQAIALSLEEDVEEECS